MFSEAGGNKQNTVEYSFQLLSVGIGRLETNNLRLELFLSKIKIATVEYKESEKREPVYKSILVMYFVQSRYTG